MIDGEPNEILDALGLPPATDVVRMPGFDATVWRASLLDGRTVAVRWLRAGYSAERELAALELAAALGLPVPAVLTSGVCRARIAVVSSWCAGRPVGDLLVDGGDPVVLGRIFGRTQAELHAPAPQSSTLAALGPSGVLDGAPAGSPDPFVLAHLDFQPFNILTDGTRATGIVDWCNAALADRRADIARTRAILSVAHTVAPFPAGTIATFVAAWHEGYAEIRPMPDDAELAPFVVAAATVIGTEWVDRVVQGAAIPALQAALDKLINQWSA